MTDNTSMLERMARAMADAESCGGWDSVTPDWRPLYFGMARAALQAIREPSEAVGSAMDEAIDALEYGRGPLGAVWTRAIDAILSESPTNG